MSIKQEILKFPVSNNADSDTNYLPMKTSAVSGPDFEFGMGYGQDAVLLDQPNVFGNLHRFTGLDGDAVNFTDKIVLDHASCRPNTSGDIYMYYGTLIGGVDFYDCVEIMRDMTVGGFTGWVPANPSQLISLYDWYGNIYAYGVWLPPFNGMTYWRGQTITSCALWPYDSNALRTFGTGSSICYETFKDSPMNMAAVRLGNISELTF